MPTKLDAPSKTIVGPDGKEINRLYRVRLECQAVLTANSKEMAEAMGRRLVMRGALTPRVASCEQVHTEENVHPGQIALFKEVEDVCEGDR